jgi:hypothetical protein
VNQKTDIEMARTAMLKMIRAAVRLKHAIAADEELNYALPQAEAAFNKALHSGQLEDGLNVLDIVQEVLDEKS